MTNWATQADLDNSAAFLIQTYDRLVEACIKESQKGIKIQSEKLEKAHRRFMLIVIEGLYDS